MDQQRRVAAVVDDEIRNRCRPARPAPRSCTTSTRGGSSPFQAKTGTPRGSATVPPLPGAADGDRRGRMVPGWRRCLQGQPSARRRRDRPASSISTAVWTVMWRLPMTLAPASGPLSGMLAPESPSVPGISCSARADLVPAVLRESEVGHLERWTSRREGLVERVKRLSATAVGIDVSPSCRLDAGATGGDPRRGPTRPALGAARRPRGRRSWLPAPAGRTRAVVG